METPLLLEIIQETLIPLLSTKNPPKSTDDFLVLTQGFFLPFHELISKQMMTQEGNNLIDALILMKSGTDPLFSIKYLEKICSAYENLISTDPTYKESLFEIFAEALGIFGSYMPSIFEISQLFSIIRQLKYKGNDVSSIILSIYPNFSFQVQIEIANINQNLNESFSHLVELLQAMKKAIKTGLDDQTLLYVVIDSVFSYIEQQINYPALIESGANKFYHKESAILLYYVKNIGNLSINCIQRLDRLINIVGIEVPIEAQNQNLIKIDDDLPNLNFDDSQVKENSKAMHANENRNFHVEVKRCIYQKKQIVVKRYSQLEGKPWNPEDYYDEIKILKICSEFTNPDNSSCFLKFYGATVKSNSVSIYLEYLEESLDKRIKKYKSSNKCNIVEFEIVIRQLIRGFASLENIGIMHKDIKPGNILITGEDENVLVKIIDFGSSKIKTIGLKSTHTAKAITTLNYRAPEILGLKEACYNVFKADAFSLGLTLYEMYSLEDISGLNEPRNHLKLLEGLEKIKVEWIHNLLRNLLCNVENRITIKECVYLLPGEPTR